MHACVKKCGQKPSPATAEARHQFFLQIPPPVNFLTGAGHKKKKQGDPPDGRAFPLAVNGADLLAGKWQQGGCSRFARPEDEVEQRCRNQSQSDCFQVQRKPEPAFRLKQK